ncbi:cilia- and flagella-associated protein 95-like [Heptranchias perlo]|uniref:cilia- and flagella-associated protein 95-like n=1 Tax=Heptranchias perlo TaxID=212740 RepID=UPI003559C26D
MEYRVLDELTFMEGEEWEADQGRIGIIESGDDKDTSQKFNRTLMTNTSCRMKSPRSARPLEGRRARAQCGLPGTGLTAQAQGRLRGGGGRRLGKAGAGLGQARPGPPTHPPAAGPGRRPDSRYQHREAEPKDYDIDTVKQGQKNLHRSTYKRLSNLPDGDWSTTSEYFLSQINLKEDYRLRPRKPLMNQKTVAKEFFKRTAGCPETNHSAVLPKYHPNRKKMYLETTYTYDYTPPYHYTPSPLVTPPEIADYRKCHSQFVDIDDFRRQGRNTWQDESGIYANSELKKVLFPPFNPIPTRLR